MKDQNFVTAVTVVYPLSHFMLGEIYSERY